MEDEVKEKDEELEKKDLAITELTLAIDVEIID